MNQRRQDECQHCGEVREVAAYGLCFACYRAEAREKLRRERGPVDRHNGAIRREHKVLFRAYANVMAGLTDLKLSREDILDVKAIIEPYLEPIQQYLDRVNSERNERESTVHFAPEIAASGNREDDEHVSSEHEKTQVHVHPLGLEVGQTVSYTNKRTRGEHVGTVVECTGDAVVVKPPRGRSFTLPLTEIRKAVPQRDA